MILPNEMADIEAASASVRAWFGDQVRRKIAAPPIATGKPLRMKLTRPKEERPVRLNRIDRIRPKVTPRVSRPKISGAHVLAKVQAGQRILEIAKDLDVTAKYVSKLFQQIGRDGTPEQKAIHETLVTCECGKPKYPGFPACNRCRRNVGRKEERARVGRIRNAACTIEKILAGWKRGQTSQQIAVEIGCSGKVVADRIREALGHPDYGPIVTAMVTCACGRGKHPTAEVCYRCRQGGHRV